MLRAAIVEKLGEYFHARVELDSFHVSLIDGLRAEGRGLRIWPPAHMAGVTVPASNTAGGASGTKPLIQLAEFRFDAPLRLKPGEPIRISTVELMGLVVDVPAKPHFTHLSKGGSPQTAPQTWNGSALLRLEVDSVECKDAHLTLETSKPGKLPLEFDIQRFRIANVSAGGPMRFEAELTNPRPKGTIVASGSIGPWVVEDPGETAISGNYRLERADLSVFHGIAGILTSAGGYQGTLRDMTVDGMADTPDFRLTHFGTALPLHTRFHANVDGTDGDTWLQPVDAVLGRSHFTAEGRIVRVPAATMPNGSVLPGGHEISLNVDVDRGRIEDFLRLASKSGTPLLTGALALKTTLEIPPGTDPVHDRLKLNGSFVLQDAEFTNGKFQKDVQELSLRGQGRVKDAMSGGVDVRSVITSHFTMAEGIITLPNLQYTVPGAEIDLAGTYDLDRGGLDFKGTARTQATVSQMVGGWKGALLKPADAFFKKDGAGTLVSIHIGGTVEDPKFGVDILPPTHTSPQIPGQPN
ncbi:MAG: AsmA-like C-terminal region-containing protein [Terracidiphilus sp.]